MSFLRLMAVWLLAGIVYPVLAGSLEAKAVAESQVCSRVAPFHWEIGDANGVLAQGTVGTGVTRETVLQIASASKWIFAAYAVQSKPSDIGWMAPYLNLTSGHSDMAQCGLAKTVGECWRSGGANLLAGGDIGRFDYGGGHMQTLAVLIGLGDMTPQGLAQEVGHFLGITVDGFGPPQPAGGARMSASQYAAFLQNMAAGKYTLSSMLGTRSVCTDPATCPTSDGSPTSEPWNYSLGHWIETDGTFSSLGAFGFYPWVSADRKLYGLIATSGAALSSQTCGAAIRQAFVSGSVPPRRWTRRP